jgi:hypothetical protein
MATKVVAPGVSVVAEIQALRQMTVAELRARWTELYGAEPRSRNKDYLWRRLAWKVQERAYGGHSEAARARLAELASEVSLGVLRVRPPKGFDPDALAAKAEQAGTAKRTRDPRLPRPGTVLVRPYRGRELRVRVLESGFEWEGRRFSSLTETAQAITGQHWNGRLFFGLTPRSRKG